VPGVALLLRRAARRAAARRRAGVLGLELSPKFDTYIHLGDRRLGKRSSRDPSALDEPCPGIGGAQAAGGGVSARTAPEMWSTSTPVRRPTLPARGTAGTDPLLPLALATLSCTDSGHGRPNRRRQIGIPWYSPPDHAGQQPTCCDAPVRALRPRRWQEVPAFAEAVKRRTGRYACSSPQFPNELRRVAWSRWYRWG